MSDAKLPPAPSAAEPGGAEPGGAKIGAEFDVLMARAGVTVPPSARAAILASFADMRAQLALLHAAQPHTAEPAHVFRPASQ